MSGTEAVNAPAAGEAPVAPVVAPAATPAAPAAPAAPVTPEADPFDSGADTFDRKYVEKLRTEAAERRVALKQYETAFEPYGEEERAVWLGLAQLTAMDPKAGAKALADLSKALEEGFTPEEAADKAGIAPADEDKPLTKKELDAYMAQQRQEIEINTAAAKIEAQATAAGYKVGSKEYKLLLTRAIELNYDLDAAIKEEAAEKQAIIDKFVADKVAAGEKWPTTTPAAGAGSPNPSGNEPKTMAEAKASLQARLGATPGK